MEASSIEPDDIVNLSGILLKEQAALACRRRRIPLFLASLRLARDGRKVGREGRLRPISGERQVGEGRQGQEPGRFRGRLGAADPFDPP